MKYFLDTEFNGFGGSLMSLALVREDDKSLYIVYPRPSYVVAWVRENVEPVLFDIPSHCIAHTVTRLEGVRLIANFLSEDPDTPRIITDWPDYIKYFYQAIITGPGEMASISRFRFDVIRVDAYPTDLPGAVQHNALWDALALKACLTQRNINTQQ